MPKYKELALEIIDLLEAKEQDPVTELTALTCVLINTAKIQRVSKAAF